MNENTGSHPACPMEAEELIPAYYAKCGYYWPEFFDKGAFVYSEVRFCPYREKLECGSMEEAQKITAGMNLQRKCPLCGRSKFKAVTDFDLFNEQRIISEIVNSGVNGR